MFLNASVSVSCTPIRVSEISRDVSCTPTGVSEISFPLTITLDTTAVSENDAVGVESCLQQQVLNSVAVATVAKMKRRLGRGLSVERGDGKGGPRLSDQEDRSVKSPGGLNDRLRLSLGAQDERTVMEINKAVGGGGGGGRWSGEVRDLVASLVTVTKPRHFRFTFAKLSIFPPPSL